MTQALSRVRRAILGVIVAALMVVMLVEQALAVPPDTEIVFEGGGWGHGVGMPQWGARRMADAGWKYEDTLAYWYHGTGLANIGATNGASLPGRIRVGTHTVDTTPAEVRPFLWLEFNAVGGNVPICIPNAVADPGFESGSLAASPHVFVDTGGAWSIVDWTPRSGAHHARYKSVNQTDTASIQANGPAGASGSHLTVSAGDSVTFSAWVKSDAGNLNRFRPRAFFYNSSGQLLTAPVGATLTPTTSYQKIDVTATAPTAAAYAVFRVQLFAEGYDGNYWVDDMHGAVVSGAGPGPCSLTAEPGDTWRFDWVEAAEGCTLRRNGTLMYGPGDCGVNLEWSDQPNTRVAFSSLSRTFARGSVLFLGPRVHNGQRGFHLVVELTLEDYLYGIAEVPTSWPAEALKSQAVAARTFAAETMRRRLIQFSSNGGVRPDCSCHLVWHTNDQAYRGWHTLTEGNPTHGHLWKAAVDDTAGRVVVRTPGSTAMAETYYFSSSGGATENVSEVWNSDQASYPYLVTKDDPWSALFAGTPSETTTVRWKHTRTAGQIVTALASGSSPAFPGLEEVTSIAILEHNASGSPRRIRVTGIVNDQPASKDFVSKPATGEGTIATLGSRLGLRGHFIHSITGFDSSPPPPPPPPIVTSVADPGFESGSLAASPHVFVNTGGAWSIVDWTPRTGTWHARYRSVNQTDTASIQANGPTGSSGSHLTVSAGDSVTFSAWVKSDAGRLNRFRPRAFFYNSSGNLLSAPVGATLTPTTSYQRIEVIATAPTGAAYAVFRVQLFAEGYDGNYWVDDMHGAVVGAPSSGSGGSGGVSDPGFESGSLAASPHVFVDTGGAWSIVDWTPRTGAHHARYKSVNQTDTAFIQANGPTGSSGSHLTVSAGDAVTFSAWVKSDAGRLNRFRPRAFFYNSSGQLLTAPVGATLTPTTSYQKIEVTATAPTGAAYVVFRVQLFAEGYDGNYWVDDMHAAVTG